MRPPLSVSTTCLGGINQNNDKFSLNQCADALNVWGINGQVEQRPGYEGIPVPLGVSGSWGGAGVGVSEDVSGPVFDNATPWPIGGFVTRTNLSAVAGDRLHIGYAASPAQGSILLLTITAPNTNAVRGEWEYWNGSVWKGIDVRQMNRFETGASSLFQEVPILFDDRVAGVSSTLLRYYFAPPKDWASRTVGTVTAYFLRVTFVSDGAGTLLAGTIVADPAFSAGYLYRGIFPASFPGGREYIFVSDNYLNTTYFYDNRRMGGGLPPFKSLVRAFPRATFVRPLTCAVIPETREAFVAVSEFTAPTMHKLTDWNIDTGITTATAEDRDFAVGPFAPWDKAQIAQLSEFPKAKFIAYHMNRLWVVDENDMLRWSAAVPYHRVWPALAYESLTEADNSPATGLFPFQEHMIVFKQDSIWAAAFSDFDAFNIPHFAVRKLVAGVGTVAMGSIKNVSVSEGSPRLVFLAEDGLYSFNGVGVTKVSRDPETGVDRLADFWPRISPGKRPFSAAAHWKTKRCYLLSVPLDGSETNTHTLVWDYVHDAFWIWDDIPAQFWLEDEDEKDNEALFFGDQYGRIYRMGVTDHDHGAAINAHVTTVALGNDGLKKRLSTLDIDAQNNCGQLTVKVYRNRAPDAFPTKSTTRTFTDPKQPVYGTCLFGTAFGYIADRLRRHDGLRVDNCNYVQVKVSQSAKGTPLVINKITAGFQPLPGRR